MDKVIFADGTEYECLFFGLATVGKLFISMKVSLPEAAQIFSNVNKTRQITFRPASGEPTTLFDYTVFEYIVNEHGGVRAALRKPYVGETV